MVVRQGADQQVLHVDHGDRFADAPLRGRVSLAFAAVVIAAAAVSPRGKELESRLSDGEPEPLPADHQSVCEIRHLESPTPEEIETCSDQHVKRTIVSVDEEAYSPLASYLQFVLDGTGYGLPKIDGWFGDQTEVAVREFQTDHALEADGVVGPDDWVRVDALADGLNDG